MEPRTSSLLTVGLNAEHELGLKFYKGTSAGVPVSVYEANPGDE